VVSTRPVLFVAPHIDAKAKSLNKCSLARLSLTSVLFPTTDQAKPENPIAITGA
jgi:hypothetical protein